jgi:hypothetical protein
MTLNEILERIMGLIDEPMWPEHAEINKAFLRTIFTALANQKSRLDRQDNILKKMFPEGSGHYFICGESGDKDSLGLPDHILICPAYGSDVQLTTLYNKVKHEPVQ